MSSSHTQSPSSTLPRDSDADFLQMCSHHRSIFTSFLQTSAEVCAWPCVILDGAGATELERSFGLRLDRRLWSAAAIMQPEQRVLVKAMHNSYLEAGADIISTVSYQASVEAFQSRFGLTPEDAEDRIRDCVRVAVEARDEFWAGNQNSLQERLKPLVAVSLGPFGSTLANGSEYSGDYQGHSPQHAVEVQLERIRMLCSVPGADLLLLETMPRADEASELLMRLFDENCNIAPLPFVMSFCCKDEQHLSDGSLLRPFLTSILQLEINRQRLESDQTDPSWKLIAIGFNCCSPLLILPLIELARQVELDIFFANNAQHMDTSFVPSMPLIAVYPNSGELWDSAHMQWSGENEKLWPSDSRLVEWYEKGARVIGGCCRSRPQQIADIRRVLFSKERSGTQPYQFFSTT